MRFLPIADTHILVEFGATIDPEIHARVIALDRYLTAHPLSGVMEKTPTYRSLLVAYEPLILSPEALTQYLQHAVAEDDASVRRGGRRSNLDHSGSIRRRLWGGSRMDRSSPRINNARDHSPSRRSPLPRLYDWVFPRIYVFRPP